MKNKVGNFKVDAPKMIDSLVDVISDLCLLANTQEGFQPLYKKVQGIVDKAYLTMNLLDPEGGYVYVLVADIPGKNIAKIGCSASINDRMYQLGIQIPFPVELALVITTPDMRGTESEMHKYFAEYRQNGEWFEVPSIIDLVAGVREQGHTYFIEARFSENGEGVSIG